jgi:hypothetical protein
VLRKGSGAVAKSNKQSESQGRRSAGTQKFAQITLKLCGRMSSTAARLQSKPGGGEMLVRLALGTGYPWWDALDRSLLIAALHIQHGAHCATVRRRVEPEVR